ncbi:MAG: DUF1799 domain-containing protein [Novosphingobium sp.]|uniref:DUF1799 domain-containing protein n=1 Tax=Novosphingobium sp. TaxID=1874826 RepID=UPI0032BCB0E0
MGAPDEVIASLKEGGKGDDFEVWAENWDAVCAFLFVATQWRAIAQGMDGRVYWQGLDYSAVAAGLAGAGIAATPALWNDLRVMEAAARNVLNGMRTGEE